MPTSRVQVRLYNAAKTQWREIRPKEVLEARWRVTRLGGYADAEIILAGLPADFPGLGNDSQIELVGWDDAQGAHVLLYRGFVLQALGQARTATVPRQTRVILYGFWDRIGRQIAQQRYLWPTSVDLSVALSALLARWAPTSQVGAYSTDYQTTGVTLDSLDAFRRPISAAVEDMDGQAAHQLVVGCDVNAGANRVYVRPFQTSALLVASYPDPSNHVELIESGADARRRCNILYLTGGKARYPNLFGAMTRDQDGATGRGNASLEAPRLGGGGYGNLLRNGDFEEGGGSLTGWSVFNSAAIKTNADPEGPAYTGSALLELDNSSGAESIGQTVSGIIASKPYTVFLAAKAEQASGTAPQILVSLVWKDGGGTTISTSTITIGGGSPTPATWTEYSTPVTSPAGATQVYFTIEATVASLTYGMHVDAVQLFRSDQLFQEGWETGTDDTAILGEVDWVVESPVAYGGASLLPYHGAYCTKLVVSSADSTHKAYLRPRGGLSVGVQGGNRYTFSKWSLSPATYSTTPNRYLVIQELGENGQPLSRTGNSSGTYRKQLASTGAYTVWTQESFTRTLSQDCRFVRCWEEYYGAGALYSDAFALRDANAPLAEYVDGEDLEATLRVDDGALGLSAPVSTSIADLGYWPDVAGEDSITTQAQAQSWGVVALTDRAREQNRPRVVWVGSPTLPGSASAPWPGQVVKAMGTLGTAVLPTPLPIAEISGSWARENGGMLLRIEATLKTDPETEARLLRRFLQTEELRRLQGRRM